MTSSEGILRASCAARDFRRIEIVPILKENVRYLGKRIYRPIVSAGCIRMICFYQNKLSRHTCLYTPSCSEYTKQCIGIWGPVVGILLGAWRILRCNPFSKGGTDPAPELFWKKKWLL